MEHDPIALTGQNDPISAKFNDDEAMLRAVQQAVTDAVEKARKLGFFEDNCVPTQN